VADVEDAHGVSLELVCVGDVPLDERLSALGQAAREAMVNAVKYGGGAGSVSIYAEVVDDDVTVYVRDRGPGFDLAEVPDDRRGVRDSIIGRMSRNGGEAIVRPMNGAGTQVELRMKVSA
jgi:signal transduction histidine kinase